MYGLEKFVKVHWNDNIIISRIWLPYVKDDIIKHNENLINI